MGFLTVCRHAARTETRRPPGTGPGSSGSPRVEIQGSLFLAAVIFTQHSHARLLAGKYALKPVSVICELTVCEPGLKPESRGDTGVLEESNSLLRRWVTGSRTRASRFTRQSNEGCRQRCTEEPDTFQELFSLFFFFSLGLKRAARGEANPWQGILGFESSWCPGWAVLNPMDWAVAKGGGDNGKGEYRWYPKPSAHVTGGDRDWGIDCELG